MLYNKEDTDFKIKLLEDNSDLDLIGSFVKTYPKMSAIRTREQILTLVNLNSEIRDWYLTFKETRAVYLDRPDWLPETQEALADWGKLKDSLTDQKARNRDWNARISKKSDELKREIETVEAEKRLFYKGLDPIAVIHSLNVNFLPLEEVMLIALEGDLEKREKLTQEFVIKLKKSFYTEYKETGIFKNPYLK